MNDKARITVRQKKSVIGYTQSQRSTVRGLGLRRIGDKREVEDTPSVRGMINKVSHLVEVVED